MQAARDRVPLGRLAAVRGRVAEQFAADLGEVDVGLADAAALAAVALGLAPAELVVLDLVHVFGDPQHLLDEVGDAVAVGVGEVAGRRSPRPPSGRRSCARTSAISAPAGRCRRCGWDRGRRSAAARASVGRGFGAMNGFWLGEARLGTASARPVDAGGSRGHGGQQQERSHRETDQVATAVPHRQDPSGRLGPLRHPRRRYFPGDASRRAPCA